MRDGIHVIKGSEVYVVDDMVQRGIRRVNEYHTSTLYVIRAHRGKRGVWETTGPISVDAFRSGLRRGTIMLF